MKDTWRDDRRNLKGQLYATMGPCKGITEMHSYGVVQIEGENDATAVLIQKKIGKTGLPQAIDAIQKKEVQYALYSPGHDIYPITQYVMDYLPAICYDATSYSTTTIVTAVRNRGKPDILKSG